MEKKFNKSVRFTETTDEKFGKIAEKLGRSKQDLLAEMVEYFYRSKKDPGDANDGALKQELGQGISRILSFVKVQERDILTPILVEQKLQQQQLSKQGRLFHHYFGSDEANMATGYFMNISRALDKDSKTVLIEQQKTGSLLERLISEVKSFQGIINDLRMDKDRIRNHFILLFEKYMREREDLSSLKNTFGVSADVKRLQEETRSKFKSV